MPYGWPSRFCCDEDLELLGYDGRKSARDDLARWRAGRPRPATRELIDVIRERGVDGAAVLDVGAGVGAVYVSLLEAGAATAVDVDASREYLATARAEAARRGLVSRVDYRYGDLVELAPELAPADIVTLDSVICCYPHLPSLLAAAASVKPRLIGLTYPRDVWWMRVYMRLWNLGQAIRRSRDRYFIYRHSQVGRLLASAGFVATYDGGPLEWRVVLYERA
jgi:magnesium-protoporphyrin O-methyltransferase